MDFHCDAVRMSAMALRDGEPSSLSGAQIQAHLAGCAPCRQELEGLGKAMAWFEGCVRRDSAEDLWPEIARQLDVSARKERRVSEVHLFIVLSTLLIVLKVLHLTVGFDSAFTPRVLSLLAVALVFLLRKEFPLRIHPDLTLKGEPAS